MRTRYFLTAAMVLSSGAIAWSAQNVPMAGSDLGSVTGGQFKQALTIIEKKCTACHSESVINAALAANKDMAAIQKQMEKKGARLSRNDRQVLGIYWKQQPLKKKGQPMPGQPPESNLPAHAIPAH